MSMNPLVKAQLRIDQAIKALFILRVELANLNASYVQQRNREATKARVQKWRRKHKR